MPKLSAEKETNLFLSEMLSPTLKKSEAVKLKKLEGKNLLNDCLKTIRGTNA